MICPEYNSMAFAMDSELAREFRGDLSRAEKKRKASLEKDRNRILTNHTRSCPTCKGEKK